MSSDKEIIKDKLTKVYGENVVTEDMCLAAQKETAIDFKTWCDENDNVECYKAGFSLSTEQLYEIWNKSNNQ